VASTPAAAAGVGEVTAQAAIRRTFAIVSHPDAGKTTTTEKLLLYAGALDRAGSVKAHSGQSQRTSDWMEFERRRGISITATALQFPHGGLEMTLLDTPGHHDFSEDTLRGSSGSCCDWSHCPSRSPAGRTPSWQGRFGPGRGAKRYFDPTGRCSPSRRRAVPSSRSSASGSPKTAPPAVGPPRRHEPDGAAPTAARGKRRSAGETKPVLLPQ